MNYGYNKNSFGWKESKKQELAEALSQGLKIPIGYVAGFHNLYIEIDGSYGGVRIRHLTHLRAEDYDKLIDNADKIYNKVMEINNQKNKKSKEKNK